MKYTRWLLAQNPASCADYQALVRFPFYFDQVLQKARSKARCKRLERKLESKLREALEQLEKRHYCLCQQAGEIQLNLNRALSGANRKEEIMTGESDVSGVKRFCGDCYGPVLPKEHECFKCGSGNIQLAPAVEEQAEIKPCPNICTENPPPLYGNFGCPLPAR